MAAAGRAIVRGRGLIQCSSPPEQHPEPERTVVIATLIGPAVSRLGLGQRPLLFEQSAEVRGGGAMATLIGATISCLRFNHAPLGLEQQAEVESASAVAELIGSTVSRLGLGQRPLLFEQSAEVRGGGAMATLIGVTVGRMRFNNAPVAREWQTDVESASGLGWLEESVRLSPDVGCLRHCQCQPPRLWRYARWCDLGPVRSREGSVIAVRRCESGLLERRRCRVAGRPFRNGGPGLAARGRVPAGSDAQPRFEYQCQREHTGQDDDPQQPSRARLVG